MLSDEGPGKERGNESERRSSRPQTSPSELGWFGVRVGNALDDNVLLTRGGNEKEEAITAATLPHSIAPLLPSVAASSQDSSAA